jgi:hypothetical protein
MGLSNEPHIKAIPMKRKGLQIEIGEWVEVELKIN